MERFPMSNQYSAMAPETLSFLHESKKAHLIGGHWADCKDEKNADVFDPSTGAVITTVPLGGQADVDDAVRAAQGAFPVWSSMSPKERSMLLHRWADAIEEKQNVLAQIESLDVGKALINAEGFDIPFGIACIRYFADFALKAQYDVPLSVPNMDARTHRASYGPCGFIFPWNFPFDLLVWNISPALAAGNTIVVKPSVVTPLSTLYACGLAEKAGIPPGVINVVLGDGQGAGTALAKHSGIRRMSFTGSSSVGRGIAEACGRNLVPCKLELGGKGAAVVFEDVDIEDTARKLVAALTLNTGQVCCTATRWIVQESVFDRFVDKASDALQSIKVGPSLNRDTQMGPLTSKTHLETVLGYLEKGWREGAVVLAEGQLPREEERSRGYFVKPVLLTGNGDNICCAEEIFGPVAFLMKFKSESDAVEIVNRSEYGLANSVWSRDLVRANRTAERLVAGNNWINAHNVFAYGLPYGGVRLSGMGGGVNSPDTFYDYLRSQTIARPLDGA
jgi:aldehyde dehydrogenase (NAD+)